MRLLLDEHLPIGLAAELHGHTIDTVSGRGWSGTKNGELLRRMSGQYDVLVTMDRSIEFQQRIPTLPFGIVLVSARLASENKKSFMHAQRNYGSYLCIDFPTWTTSTR